MAIIYTYILDVKYCRNTAIPVFLWYFLYLYEILHFQYTAQKNSTNKKLHKKSLHNEVWVFYISNNRTCFNKKPTFATSQVSTSFLNLYWAIKSVSHMLYFWHSFHMLQETYILYLLIIMNTNIFVCYVYLCNVTLHRSSQRYIVPRYIENSVII